MKIKILIYTFELPLNNLIYLSDYDQGKDILEKWENGELIDVNKEEEIFETVIQNYKDSDYTQKRTNNILNILFIALVSLCIGVIATIYYYRSPIQENGIDYDDSIPEEWWIYKGDKISEVKVDRNRDGSTDIYYFYNRQGLLTTAKSNGDGVFDLNIKYDGFENPIKTS